MTTTNNGRQEIPLRRLFPKSTGHTPSPVDKPRRATLAPQLQARQKLAPYKSRIEKHRANSHKRRGRASPELDQQFAGRRDSLTYLLMVVNPLSDGIEDSRKEIRKAADKVLVEVEGDANIELARVVEEFEEKLRLALDYETRAFQSIADERLLITLLSSENKVVEKEEAVFGDRMQVFQRVIEEEEKALESLWQEWTEIQSETVCLAFEVLGPGEVSIDEEQMSIIASDKVDAAIRSYASHQGTLKDTLDGLATIQDAVKKVTSRTLQTLKHQQRVGAPSSVVLALAHVLLC